MPSEIREPPHRTPHPDIPDTSATGAEGTNPPDLEATDPEPLPPYSSTSGDELNVLLNESLAKLKPDPLLGEFSADPSDAKPLTSAQAGTGSASRTESFDKPTSWSAVRSAVPPGIRTESSPSLPLDAASLLPPEPAEAAPTTPESFAALANLLESRTPGATDTPGQPSSYDAISSVPHTESFARQEQARVLAGSELLDPALQPASSVSFPELDLSSPPPAKSEPEPSEEDEEDDLPARGPSISTFLLFSYASAVTIGLVWVLLSGRKLRDTEEGDTFPPADTRPDPGVRADRSRKVATPPPIDASRVTSLRKMIRLGDLEATPLAITTGKVMLKRALKDHEYRAGGADALKLKLRLKNVSKDTIFAPLDEGFLRERERDVPDSFIEAGDHAPIVMYPLAITSEWSIDGQVFRELRPGQSFDAMVVSDINMSDLLTPEMTWRVRLRTGMSRTDTLGIRFSESDVHP